MRDTGRCCGARRNPLRQWQRVRLQWAGLHAAGISGKALLLTALALLALAFLALWWRSVQRARIPLSAAIPGPIALCVGAVTDFLDTLGIGSFATTTSLYKLGRMVSDEEIPGTMNIGHAVPTFAEAFIFIAVVEVEVKTLALMIAASVVGAWFGAGVVAGWPRRKIQLGMGVLMFIAALIMVARQLGVVPGGGAAMGLEGGRLAVGVAGNLVLGALMTLGIGLFAPCMILMALLGMNQATAFPIMMGSCAFLMPAGSVRFLRLGRYNLRAAVGLTLGGLPAVLVAAFIVKSLPLAWVKWLVVAVVVYTATAMLRSAAKGRENV
jgi:uncharacterized membrane protein YfcA